MFKKKYTRLSESSIREMEKEGKTHLIVDSSLEKFTPVRKRKTYKSGQGGAERYEMSIEIVAKSRHYYGYRWLFDGEAGDN